jgi:hypothetical protein
MARDRRKSKKQRNTGKPRTTQPQRRAPVNVKPDNSAQHSRVHIAFRRLVQSLKKVKILLSIIGVAALLLGFALDIDDAISKWLSRKHPAAEIMYFKKQGSNYNLIEPGNVVLQPSKEELEKSYVPVPVNLAVRNQEKGRLEATRVEISYPKGLRVTPQGRPKIDPQNNTLIYEHDLRSLEPVASFTPLDTIDVIYLHYSVRGLKTTVFLHDGLVGFITSVGAEVTDRPYGVDLQVRLFSHDRPPLATKLHLSIDTSQAYKDPAFSEKEPAPGLLTNRDVVLFNAVSRRLRTASRVWEVRSEESL